MNENVNNDILENENIEKSETFSEAAVAEEQEVISLTENTFSEESISAEPSPIDPPTETEEVEDSSAESVCMVVEEPKKGSKKKINGALLTVGIMCAIICVTTVAFAIGLAMDNNQGSFEMPPVYTPDYEYTSTITEDNAVLLDKAGVSAKVTPSTVLIETEVQTAYTTGRGMGSGFIFTENGLIITNAHVVEGAISVTVTLHDGSFYEAEIVGSDSSSDIAVLRIDAEGLVPVEIGDSSKVVVGEDVVAIGNPYDAKLAFSSTYGAVSAIRDSFHFEDLGILLDVFQHDAAINSGNSGGVLCNMYGQVIGINAIKITGYDNIGFAIQINSVLDVIEDLINFGSIQRPTLGITCGTETSIGGVYVASVTEGSAAEKAGILPDDIITKFDGVRIRSLEELQSALNKYSAGDKCTITVLRDAESITLDIVLDEAY